MKAHVAFDTLDFVETLIRAGVENKKAEALSKATSKAFSQFLESHDIVTKESLKHELLESEKRMYSFIMKALTFSVSSIMALQTLFHFFR